MKDVLGFREFLCPSSSSAPGAQPALNHKVHGPEPWKAMSPRSPGALEGAIAPLVVLALVVFAVGVLVRRLRSRIFLSFRGN